MKYSMKCSSNIICKKNEKRVSFKGTIYYPIGRLEMQFFALHTEERLQQFLAILQN